MCGFIILQEAQRAPSLTKQTVPLQPHACHCSCLLCWQSCSYKLHWQSE